MTDLISRQSALDIVFDFAEAPHNMYQKIRELPSAEKHGKWIAVEYNDGTVHTECSVCGYGRGLPPVRNYCPNCGARMEAEDETN